MQTDHLDIPGNIGLMLLVNALGFQAERDILFHGQPREQAALLEHIAPLGIRPLDRFTSKAQGSALRMVKPCDKAKQRGLSTPGRPDNRHKLARIDGQADIRQCMDDTSVRSREFTGHMFNGQLRIHACGHIRQCLSATCYGEMVKFSVAHRTSPFCQRSIRPRTTSMIFMIRENRIAITTIAARIL